VVVGGPSRNAGIVAFSADPAAGGKIEVFLRVKNFADLPAKRRLVVANASKTQGSRQLEIPPGGSVDDVSVVRLAAEDPVLRVRLEGPDDGLRADDEAAAVFSPLVVVALGEKSSPAYARLFGGPVFEGTLYLETRKLEPGGVPRQALLIADGAIPAAYATTTVVVNPPTGEVAGIRVGAEKSLAQPSSPLAAREDPLLRSVALAELRIDRFRPLTLPSTARPLLKLGGDVVAASAELPEGKVIVLSFDPARAAWYLRPSFVVFWVNVLRDVKGRGGGGNLIQYRTGDVVRLPLGAETARLRGPEGQAVVRPDADGWGDVLAPRVGVYEWVVRGDARSFAVNLLSEIESDNCPRSVETPTLDLPAPRLAGRMIPLAPWLCLLAGVLTVVWWHFRR